MSKFTPGPWKLETAPGGANDGWQISSENTSCGKGRYVVLASRGPITGEEFAGNARLIAAAPEMKDLLWDAWQDLNALSQGDQTYDACYEATKTMEKIMSLLRRIEGEDA